MLGSSAITSIQRGGAEEAPSAASLWSRIALPARSFARLEGDVIADVAIVGGGFTGLSTAHFLAKAGIQAVVLDANVIGWGASGRNGGFVSSRFRVPFSAMAVAHGKDMARRMHCIGLEAVDTVEEIVEELGIACEFGRHGTITGAHNLAAFEKLRRTAVLMRNEFGDASRELLDRDAMRDLTGSPTFVGGSLNRRAGGIHPLSYARGVAAALAERGVRLFERSAVIAIEPAERGILTRTSGGNVRARQVVIATNGYAGLTGVAPRLTHSVVPFQSAVIATVPLGQKVLAEVLPQGQLLSDTRRVLRWARVVDGRLVFGGRGAFGDGTSEATYNRLLRQMQSTFPQTAGALIDFRWSGYVAMTMDELPHIGRLGEHIHFALGYNGTGVAMSNLMGRYMAKILQGETVDLGLLSAPPPRIPLHGLRAPAIRIATAWLQVLDRFG